MPIQIKVGADIQDAITGLKKVEAQASQSTGRVTKNFTGLTRVIQDLPFGFVAISNNLEQIVPAAGSVGLAFSGVVAALTFAQIGFGNWTRGLGGLIGSTKQAKIALGDFKEVFENAAKASGDDIVRLEVFKQKLNDANTPASERLKILKEYNAIADKTNEIDAKQINNLDLINQKIEAQNALIIKRALSTAALSKITEAANKLVENEMKLQEELTRRGFKDLEDFENQTSNVDKNSQKLKQTLRDLATQKILNPQGLPESVKGLDGIVNPAQKAATAVQQTDNNFNSLVNSVKKGRGELQTLAKNLSGLITIDGLTTQKTQDKSNKDKHAFLFDFLPFDPTGKLKPEQRAQLIDAIDKFQKDVGGMLVGVPLRGGQEEVIKQAFKIDAEIKSGRIKFNPNFIKGEVEKSFNKIDEVLPNTKTLDTLPQLVVDQFVRGFQNESEKVKNENLLGTILQLDDPQGLLDSFKLQLQRLGAQIPKTIEATDIFGIKRVVSFSDLFDTGQFNVQGIKDALKGAFDDISSDVDGLAKKLSQTLQAIGTEMFSSFGEALGTALAGGGLRDVFQSLFSFIGSAIADLGKQMIAMSPIIAALKLAIKSLNPALLLPAGIALVAIGSALRNIKPKGFAEGGLVFGPTLGLVGEGRGTTRNNPEVIAPLDKLKSFLAGSAVRSSGGGQLIARVSGRDLLFLLTQESNSQGRNFGRSSF